MTLEFRRIADRLLIMNSLESQATQTMRNQNQTEAQNASTPADNRRHHGRFIALDALRGLSIFLMLLVNNIGADKNTPQFLVHANWTGGVHVADFVFPAFLFCVGVAISFSQASARDKGVTPSETRKRILRRFGWLMALGFVVSSSHAGRLIFEMGILELIGASYLIAALIYDRSVSLRISVAFALLLAYWYLLKFVPYPGGFAGAFSEGQHIIEYINRAYLSKVMLEGLPLVAPTSALVLIGTVVGDLIRKYDFSPTRSTGYLTVAAAALIFMGYVWSLDFPFNKPIMTSSFMLLSAGVSTLILALFDLLTDVMHWRAWTFPLIVFGSNAILAYVLSILVKEQILIPLHIPTAGLGSLIYTGLWWLILLALYRKKMFVRV